MGAILNAEEEYPVVGQIFLSCQDLSNPFIMNFVADDVSFQLLVGIQ